MNTEKRDYLIRLLTEYIALQANRGNRVKEIRKLFSDGQFSAQTMHTLIMDEYADVFDSDTRTLVLKEYDKAKSDPAYSKLIHLAYLKVLFNRDTFDELN